MACKLCQHDHKGPCYPDCPVCNRRPAEASKPVEPEIDRPDPVVKATKPAPMRSTQSERNRRYREKNRERYNAYMREYRKGRADE